MRPTRSHRFYVAEQDTVVELSWPARATAPAGFLERLVGWLAGPDWRLEPCHAVHARAFDEAIGLLATDIASAVTAFTGLGYRVAVDRQPALRTA